MGSCASLCSQSECSPVKPPPAPSETVKDKFEIPPSPIKHYKLQHNADSVFKDISVVPHHHKTPSGLILLRSFLGFGFLSVFFPPHHSWIALFLQSLCSSQAAKKKPSLILERGWIPILKISSVSKEVTIIIQDFNFLFQII